MIQILFITLIILTVFIISTLIVETFDNKYVKTSYYMYKKAEKYNKIKRYLVIFIGSIIILSELNMLLSTF